jgi:iron-sulfur cluster repair protein YtfE (RIC family)
MDADELLRKDHEAVRGLFQAFENAEVKPKARSELFAQIRELLQVHSRIEEEIFYPALAQVDDEGRDLVKEAREEHAEVDELLVEIADLDPTGDYFAKKVDKLRKKVEHHAGEEEDEMFPFAQRQLGDMRLAELGRELEMRKQELSPRSPDAPVR